ncbi:MAG: glycosyltransferase family 2 protein [Blastocatellia bacterium]
MNTKVSTSDAGQVALDIDGRTVGHLETRDPQTKTRPRVLCVAPAWNEGERIARVVGAVPGDFVETTVVVDDGSTDDTANYAKAAGATVIRSASNRGVGAAIRSGIDFAIEQGYDIVVVVSGGGKTPPDQIPRLLRPIIEDKAELAQ